MIAWLWKLIVGNFCRHEWETKQEGRFEYITDFSSGVGEYKHLQCKKCGDWKRRDLK